MDAELDNAWRYVPVWAYPPARVRAQLAHTLTGAVSSFSFSWQRPRMGPAGQESSNS